jgi:transcriptional regulator with XRE-family HTH domain
LNTEYLRIRKEEIKMSFDEIAKRSGLAKRPCIGIINNEGKYSNPTDATRRAIEQALGLDQKETPPELSDGEKALLELFSRVPADKQEMVVEMIRVALKSQE